MLVTLLGITVLLEPAISVLVAVSMMALQFSRESYFELLASTFIEVRPEQLEKARSLMYVTLLGMVTEVRPEQP